MSELDEPPAKVLKIDTIDGVTHVTEVSSFPEPFDGVVEEEIMGEESGIIEGGADPEHEEWLSEGILTDDDYNPASQETIEDRTDSQLGTEDEEHLDSTLDSEANITEIEAHLADNEEHLADNDEHLADNGQHLADNDEHLADNDEHLAGNGQHLADNEAHLADNDEHLADNEAHLADNDEHLADNEAQLADNDEHLADSEEHLADSEAHLADNEAHLADNDEHLADSEEHLADSEAHLADNEAHLADNDEHLADSEEHLADSEAHSADNEANLAGSEQHDEANLVANGAHTSESDATVGLENGIHTTGSEADMTMSEANMTQSDTNVTNSEELTRSVKQLMEVSNLDSSILESQTYTQEYPIEMEKLEPNVNIDNASDIVIQRVIKLNKNSNVKEIEVKTGELNIEETMKHLDGKKDDMKSDDFEGFLNKSEIVKPALKMKTEVRQEEQDDENDTDDLLRMLGEGDSKGKKKLTKTVKDVRKITDGGASSDDDDFVYEGSCASLTNLKAVKHALAKKQAVKAVPEDMEDGDDETEMSADETKTMQRMFGFNSKSILSRRPPKTASPHTVVKRPPTIVNVVERPKEVKPTRQYQNKRLLQSRAQSILKPTTHPIPIAAAKTPTSTPKETRTPLKRPEVKAPGPFKPAVALQTIDKKINKERRFEPGKMKIESRMMKIEPGKMKVETGKLKFEPGKMKVGSGKVTFAPEKMEIEPEEIINEEEFLDDEEFGLDEDEFAEPDIHMSHHRQRIMRPEMMDEEVPSDGESASEDGSLYDELPSSDSDDMDDWFTLDIRSENAGDYIPLLGPKAKDLLLEEKRRVSARLSTLKQSHTALIVSGKQQAATVRRATATLAELDDMLRAA